MAMLMLILLFVGCTFAQELEVLNIDPNSISVSGISSGACMASQFHVSYSRDVMGVAMFAGAPYYCAEGSAITAISRCMERPWNVDVADLQAQAETYAGRGEIDFTYLMNGDRVYIFNGIADQVVDPGGVDNIRDFYDYTSSSNIRAVTNINAGHGQPTMNVGNPCTSSYSPYINNCGYDGAFEALDWIYGGLTRPDRTKSGLRGTLKTFDQREFFYISLPSASSMDNTGFVYVPENCQNGVLCKLHIALHGCLMGREEIGNAYALDSGYNEVADANDIVILYPQAISSLALPSNPQGCWDWWGYTIIRYATKGANQPLAIARMVDKIANMNIAESYTFDMQV